jgi:death-on-curing protein
MGILFLTVDEILEIHRDQIDRYGGDPAIRDIRLLESAQAMPCMGLADDYVHKDIFEMAAAYLFHITQNHPFVDGNKRTGAAAALVFLAMNDLELEVDESAFESLVREVAGGRLDKAAVAEFIRKYCQA